MPFLGSAEALFWDNVHWNTSLAKRRAKKRRRVGYSVVSPEMLLQKLEMLELKIDRRTLTNYVKWGLMTPPEQRVGGKGVHADFSEQSFAEAATAVEFMRRYRWTKKTVAMSRRLAFVMDEYGRWDEGAAFAKMVAARQMAEEIGESDGPERENLLTAMQEDILFAVAIEYARLWWRMFQTYSTK
ncbi:MAG: hypothetical protein DDT21_00352 [Syntrophomonadaceae bacterium]|nr:hypothetical protein [Bacillota bacterium]